MRAMKMSGASEVKHNEIELDQIVLEMIDKKNELMLQKHAFKKSSSSSLRKQLKIIIDPVELAAVFNDPESPEYKLLMQLIEAGIAQEIFYIKLLENWFQAITLAETKTKEQAKKDHIAATYVLEQRLQACLQQISNTIIKKIKTNTDIDQVQKLLVKLPKKIESFKKESLAIQLVIKNLQSQKKDLNDNWRKRCVDFNDALITELKEKLKQREALKIYAVVNNQLQEISVNQFEQIVKPATPTVTFEEKLQHNHGLREKLLELWRESKETAMAAAKMESVFDQINKFGHLCGDNHFPMTKLIRANKQLNTIMSNLSHKQNEMNAQDINDLFSITECLSAEQHKLIATNHIINEMTKLLNVAKEHAIKIENNVNERHRTTPTLRRG